MGTPPTSLLTYLKTPPSSSLISILSSSFHNPFKQTHLTHNTHSQTTHSHIMSGLLTKLKDAVVGHSEPHNDQALADSGYHSSIGPSSTTGQGYVGGSDGQTAASYVPGTQANAQSGGLSSSN